MSGGWLAPWVLGAVGVAGLVWMLVALKPPKRKPIPVSLDPFKVTPESLADLRVWMAEPRRYVDGTVVLALLDEIERLRAEVTR